MGERYNSRGMGTRILAARKERGLTQTDLGNAAGVTKASVSKWERGDTKSIRPENLFAIADKLRYHARWLAIADGPDKMRETDEIKPLPPQVLKLARKLASFPREKQELLLSLLGDHATGGMASEKK